MKQSRNRQPENKKFGYTIIEAIVAIGLVGFFILIYGASYTAVTSNQFLKNKSLAYNLAAEELEALRSTPFARITNRTDGNFIEVAYNKGNWSVKSDAAAPSLPNVYEIASPAGNPSGITGVAVVPGFDYDNFTDETKIKVMADSTAGWQAGVYFRYHDADNYYRVYFTGTNLYIDKKVGGVETSLTSKAKAFSTNTWYTLKVVANNNAFEVFVNGTSELTGTDAVSSFTAGRLTLLGLNSVHAYFDDISITTSATKTWNFDSDAVGQVAASWQRFGLNDLPRGIGKLTIEDAQTGFTDIKKVKARVEWYERNNLKYIELSTLISEQGLSL